MDIRDTIYIKSWEMSVVMVSQRKYATTERQNVAIDEWQKYFFNKMINNIDK